MPALDNVTLMVIGMGVIIALFASFFIAFRANLRKKLHHQKVLQDLREQQQNQLIEAAVRSEELERHRIAETLHDEVGAILSSTKLHLQGIKPASLSERDRQLYERSKELLDEGIQKVRGISHNLHSNILKEFGLNEAIRHFIKKVVQSEMLKATCELDDTSETKNPENDISIYRMVQELINNIIKHSGATSLHIASAFSGQALTITMQHNGDGLSQQQFEDLRYSRNGLGLKNIQNRIILLKGKISFQARHDDNTIHISIPLQNAVV